MSTALYRRYRPDDFADVIGQEHVTDPLMAALEKNRVNHAYLFSGPRGCGKTTSARILARCLNCVHGPTAHPCGECDSCLDLQRGGPGSLDVIEIDAASHGGVDDARDLRERATFAPVRDRYKIFIIDEAHMVTSAGFNALLKIVEEPPEHIKFIFATTEPDKVIGTIRSRTHHYPFRLVPPEPLMAYLQELCDAEQVEVAPGVLSLVARAGGGSVRDSLSVLDQLMAGAGEEGLDYELAVNLLGYTHAALLDDVVDALAANDSATVFNAVDRVIQTGHDPRRFVEDLLERFRDLIIVKAMPDEAAHIIRGLPEDQLARMRQQANVLGANELSRNADTTNKALTEMTGATSPRLHLELLCARLLLPASDHTERGMAARLDRIERHLNFAENDDAAPRPARQAPESALERQASRAARSASAPVAASSAPVSTAPASTGPVAAAPPASSPRATAAPAPAPTSAPVSTTAPASASVSAPRETAAPAPAPATEAPRSGAAPSPREESIPPRGPVRNTANDAPASPDWGNTWGALDDQPPAPPARPEVTQERPAQKRPAQDRPAQDRSTQNRPAQRPAPEQSASERPTPERPTQGRAPQEQPVQSQPAQQQPAQPQQVPAQQPARDSAPTNGAQSGGAHSGGAGSVEMFRRAWPEIMNRLSEERRAVWMAVEPHSTVAGFDGRTLTIAFSNEGALMNFRRREDNAELLRKCIQDVLGVGVALDAVSGGAAPAGGSGPKDRGRKAPAQRSEEHVVPSAAPVSPAPVSAPAPTKTPTQDRPEPRQPARQVAEAPVREQSAPVQQPQSRSAEPVEAAKPAQSVDRPQPVRPAPPVQQAEPTRPAASAAPASAPTASARATSSASTRPATPSSNDAWQYANDIEPWDPDGDPWAGADDYSWEPTPDESPAESPAPSMSAPSTPSPSTQVPPTTASRSEGEPASSSSEVRRPAQAAAPSPVAAPAPRNGGSARPVAPPPPAGDAENWGWESARDAAPATAPEPEPAPVTEPQEKPMSQRIAEKLVPAKDQQAAASQATPPANPQQSGVESSYVDEVPSDEDPMIEDSMLVGRAAVERVLDGKLIEARNLDGTPIV
ncbi:DNA polymerase-3 subunit gamma/tau [Neomicrococcus aestuarii]|uniref:DNA polymerase III subunit gamma/tau n=1 Tax=Neomicrococcus aestuarii TaxID=556325 RepID=A0A7W8X053_9MICC|nr:DNA polymerase III subunit gamma and tau [Neomicrococcus aestuarii]MBB5512508.1 DNA polymerase-3 subunit gamma/tau [Neomicrococcus aestuarii]